MCSIEGAQRAFSEIAWFWFVLLLHLPTAMYWSPWTLLNCVKVIIRNCFSRSMFSSILKTFLLQCYDDKFMKTIKFE